MSFGKAKRFNYKTEDNTPSPADYVVTTELGKGWKIPRSPRFVEDTKEDSQTITCSRLNHSQNGHCSFSERSPKNNSFRAKFDEFNRNDTKRTSIRRKRCSDNKNRTCAIVPRNPSSKQEFQFLENHEYIDDDYHSLTSSEELNNLGRLERHEFKNIRKEFRELQETNCADFQELVLEKLQNIEYITTNVKEEVESINDKIIFESNHKDEISCNDNFMKRSRTSSKINDEIKDITIAAIANLSTDFERKQKLILKEGEDKIKNVVTEMYKNNEETSQQIKILCNNTANKLVEELDRVMEKSGAPALEFLSSTRKDLENKENIRFQNSQSTISDSNISLEEEFDYVLNFGNSKDFLDIQGNILDVMKQELAELKQVLYKN